MVLAVELQWWCVMPWSCGIAHSLLVSDCGLSLFVFRRDGDTGYATMDSFVGFFAALSGMFCLLWIIALLAKRGVGRICPSSALS